METLGFAQETLNTRLALLCFLLYSFGLSQAVYLVDANSLLYSSKSNVITKDMNADKN